MNSQFSVPIPPDLYTRVEDFLRAEGNASDPVAAIALAVDRWIGAVPAKPVALAKAADAGQWNNDWIMFESPPAAVRN